MDLTAIGPLVSSLPDAPRQAARAAIERRLLPFTHASGIALPARCWAASPFVDSGGDADPPQSRFEAMHASTGLFRETRRQAEWEA